MIRLLAACFDIAVVPIHLRGVEKVLHRGEWLLRPGRVDLAFGPPLRLKGKDYAALAKQVEEAVASL